MARRVDTRYLVLEGIHTYGPERENILRGVKSDHPHLKGGNITGALKRLREWNWAKTPHRGMYQLTSKGREMLNAYWMELREGEGTAQAAPAAGLNGSEEEIDRITEVIGPIIRQRDTYRNVLIRIQDAIKEALEE